MIIESILNIQHPILEQYLTYRKIDKAIASSHGLKEINYFHSDDETKKYFALAWKNDDAGYELNRRGMYKTFKGCIGSKTTTSLINEVSNQVAIFEGFLDFLAYLSYQNITHFQSSMIYLN